MVSWSVTVSLSHHYKDLTVMQATKTPRQHARSPANGRVDPGDRAAGPLAAGLKCWTSAHCPLARGESKRTH